MFGSVATTRVRRAFLVIAALSALTVAAIVMPAGLLMLSPAIALGLLLGLGWFASDALIRRVRRMLRRRAHAPLVLASPCGQEPRAPRGTVLAFALSVRPPPTCAWRS